MDAAAGALGYISAVIYKDTCASLPRCLSYALRNMKGVTRGDVALTDLQHIRPGGKRAIRKLNQAGQVRFDRRLWQ